MGKNRKKNSTQKKYDNVPFDRFHSDLLRENTKEARRRARAEEYKAKNRKHDY